MTIYFQINNQTKTATRNTTTLVENANNPKVANYVTNDTDFGYDKYTQSNLQFAGVFNIGKKLYKRPSTDTNLL
jgi:hypothetical protein